MTFKATTTYQPLAGFCNGKSTGNYPDPTRCDGYIACVHGTPIFMKCPAHLHYNPTLDQCDWKYHVKCPYSECFLFEHYMFFSLLLDYCIDLSDYT